ncbi:phage adaptor protein [Sphingomonas sp.]|uniref:phage adaptor protein n=1 Tax=Sphingomonas sp. TaxID=28214 RepID=UPI003B3A0873
MPADPSTYSGLQASIIAWMDDSSDTFIARVPELIALSERRLSRKLNSPEMEASTTLALTDGATVLPSDLMEIRNVYIEYDNYRSKLKQETLEDFNFGYNTTETGRPYAFSLSGGNMNVRPLPDQTYAITMTYKQFLPALSDDNPTNWLLSKWPDLYLAHALLTAVDFGFETERLDWATNKAETLIAEVNDAGQKMKWGAGPLVPCPPVRDVPRLRRY